MIPNRESDAGPEDANECPACHQKDVRVGVCHVCDQLCCTECAFVRKNAPLCAKHGMRLCAQECAFVRKDERAVRASAEWVAGLSGPGWIVLCKRCNEKVEGWAGEKPDCEDWLWEAEYTLLHRRNRPYSETIAIAREQLSRAEAKLLNIQILK